MTRATAVAVSTRKPKSSRAVAPAKAKPDPKAPISIIAACRDPKIFGPWFKDAESWSNWFTFLRALFGLEMSESDLAAFRKFTGRSAPTQNGYLDATLIVGRRGGKSLVLATIAAYIACFLDWRPFLTGGERAVVLVLAADKKQAQSIFRYLRDMLDIPMLRGLITRETNELLELANSVSIEVVTASYRTIRGRTVVAALCDELAFWRTDEGANPDSEIIAALKPAMATVPGARLLKASSPYSRRGVLWNDYRKHFGRDESASLVWQGDTRSMNALVPESFIAAAIADDPESAAAEYGAQFRSDVEAFISREAVEACIMSGRFELAPLAFETHSAFVDPSGGSADSMTLAIVHREGERVIVDAICEARPPFSPESVVSDFAALLRSYGIKTVTGDRFAGEWPRERFFVHGIEYRVSEKSKSDLYRDMLPLINGCRVGLLDHPRLIAQLCALERRTARGGRDSIDHPPGQHDDIANAVAGAVVMAASASRIPRLVFG
jgi:hypothetical protein